ncbi:MAG: condensation domain-containing protein, partial [Limisphaerales bacterium]
WSVDVLLRELQVIYTALAENRPPDIAPLKVQYADFADWQRRAITPEVIELQMGYWKEQLSGPLPSLRLAPQPKKFPSYEARVEPLVFDKDLVARLREFNRSQGTTLFMSLLANFNLLLAHCSKQNEILTGAPKNNRSTPELEKLAGFFVNTLVLRTKLDINRSFEEFLAQIRSESVRSFSNADIPFQRVAQEMRAAGQSSLFQVWFGAIDTLQPLQMGQITATPRFVSPGTAQFDLAVFVSEQSDTVTCLFEYKTDLFGSEAIKGLMGQFENLLRKSIAESKRPLSELLFAKV